MYISAIMSLAIYSYFLQVISDSDKEALNYQKNQKEIYQDITNKMNEGVLI